MGPSAGERQGRRPRLTLVRAFAAGGLGLVLLLAGGTAAVLRATQSTLLEAAERLRASGAARAEALVRREFDVATGALADVEREVKLGTGSLVGPDEAEALLLRTLARDPRLAEVTFTAARRTGFSEDGEPVLAPEGRWQVSLFRTDASASVRSRRVGQGAAGLQSRQREMPAGGHPLEAPLGAPQAATDPTAFPTFAVAASRAFDGRLLWTDLAWAEHDDPARGRRVVVSVFRVLADDAGAFLGVLRVGLLASSVDAVTKLRVDESNPHDQHQVFIADEQGRLLSRLGPEDRLEVDGDDLRVKPVALPRPVAAALAIPLLRGLSDAAPEGSVAFEVDGQRWLATFRLLEGTQDWRVGIVVPESAYTAHLHQLRIWFTLAAVAASLLLLLGGLALLGALQRGLGRVQQVAAQMRGLDFAPMDSASPFRDVQEALDGLERAKTAFRALARYVPVDLVRTLYRENREPAPGGELRELTLFFSDVAGFTALSEKLAPDVLAQALGRYFVVMTKAITAAGGTVDKFIGDAVMALWNAPERRDGHAFLACAAALECQEAARRLFASPDWAGLPPLHTRIGLHRGEVMVGHFGSPDRLSYTALGDGVNLASRLEGLCKQYGVEILVSEAVEEQVRSAFLLRLVDRVAVKGRSEGVRVYQLVAARGAAAPLLPVVREYEAAFADYQRSDFGAAVARLEGQQYDAPSAVLLHRCQQYLAFPPPSGWDGVYVSTSK